MRGSKRIHKLMVLNIMGSPMAFFDVTPPGWILSRFSKDMDISKWTKYANALFFILVDARIPFSIEVVGQYLLILVCQVSTIFFNVKY